MTNMCVQCQSSDDCNLGGASCGSVCSSSGYCIGVGTNCLAQGKKCKNNQFCVDCLSDSECLATSGSSKPYCDLSGVCRECLSDDQCRSDENCNAACGSDGKCRGPAPTSALNCSQTPNTPRCDIAQARCVYCYQNTHCMDGKRPKCLISEGTCQECTTNSDCRTNQNCDAMCVIQNSTRGTASPLDPRYDILHRTTGGSTSFWECKSGNGGNMDVPTLVCPNGQHCNTDQGICNSGVAVLSMSVLLLCTILLF
jgi:hypothetical protein